jgi:hypothetical protein
LSATQAPEAVDAESVVQDPSRESGESKETPIIEEHPDRPESLTADIVKEAQSIVTRFKSEAARRLKDIERAEDAADEALLKLGNNIKSFLSDAVSIAPPIEVTDESQPDKILFESKDSDGKRTIHTNRLDAQLHVIHSSLDGFLKDPAGPEYEAWTNEFNIESRTDTIAQDLETYSELRKAMEKLVPERVDYATFWSRYYFLKKVAEFEEQRRKDLLKGKQACLRIINLQMLIMNQVLFRMQRRKKSVGTRNLMKKTLILQTPLAQPLLCQRVQNHRQLLLT